MGPQRAPTVFGGLHLRRLGSHEEARRVQEGEASWVQAGAAGRIEGGIPPGGLAVYRCAPHAEHENQGETHRSSGPGMPDPRFPLSPPSPRTEIMNGPRFSFPLSLAASHCLQNNSQEQTETAQSLQTSKTSPPTFICFTAVTAQMRKT